MNYRFNMIPNYSIKKNLDILHTELLNLNSKVNMITSDYNDDSHIVLTNETIVILPYFFYKDSGKQISYSNNTNNNINIYSNIAMFNVFFYPKGTNIIILKPNNYLKCIFNFTDINKYPYWNITIS